MRILSEEQKEKARIRAKKWNDNNRERRLETAKINYQNNKEKRLAYRKQYYKENKEDCTLQNKKYWNQNKDKLKEENMERYWENKERYNQQKKIYHKKRWNMARTQVLFYYGKGELACVCCGEKEKRFLTIDHMNNDGNQHRKKVNAGNLYYWLINNNFPKGFQTLCFNCNSGRALNKGICPHQEHQKISLNGIHIKFQGEA